ncbi:hypothetical protein [Nonomuraea deserti]|uniref:hypothetical protein n=1 Tax=Nonomuraea deserti TaxID=1848322 RepID=UPI001FE3C015|nr:hypothetical protein [Nonomuraea deserti]
MRRSFRSLLRPTARQAAALAACLEDHRQLYNASQQATLRRLDKAFSAFFKRVRVGRAPGFPRFKGHGRFDTVERPKDGDGCRWGCQPRHPSATFVRLQGVGHVRVHRHRTVKGRAKTIAVKR